MLEQKHHPLPVDTGGCRLRGVADDDVELHVEEPFWVDAMDEGVGVGFGALLEDVPGGAAERTPAALPGVRGGRQRDVALGRVEAGKGVPAVGELGAVANLEQ